MPLTRLASYDVGLLYTGVAGLLNAIVISDALGTVEELCREAASFDRIEAARVAHAEAQLRAAEAEAEALRSLQLSPLAVASTLEGAFGGAAAPGVDGTGGRPPPPPTSSSPSLPFAPPPPLLLRLLPPPLPLYGAPRPPVSFVARFVTPSPLSAPLRGLLMEPL